MIAAETLSMLQPQEVDDPDDITIVFGGAEVLDLQIRGSMQRLTVPRVDGRAPDTLKINRRTGGCRWQQNGRLVVRGRIHPMLAMDLAARFE